MSKHNPYQYFYFEVSKNEYKLTPKEIYAEVLDAVSIEFEGENVNVVRGHLEQAANAMIDANWVEIVMLKGFRKTG